MWDVLVSRDIEARHGEQFRRALTDLVSKRLQSDKRLLRVVTWCADGGGLFRSPPGLRRYVVSYQVELAV